MGLTKKRFEDIPVSRKINDVFWYVFWWWGIAVPRLSSGILLHFRTTFALIRALLQFQLFSCIPCSSIGPDRLAKVLVPNDQGGTGDTPSLLLCVTPHLRVTTIIANKIAAIQCSCLFLPPLCRMLQTRGSSKLLVARCAFW